MQQPTLPRRNALVYASGSLAGNLISRVTAAWLFFFYVAGDEDADIPRRIPVWTVGALLTAANIIEAFDDPLIGYWSDRTRSRWGRRIPFIVLATPFWALFFFFMWTPPNDQETVANAFYFFFMLLSFHLFSTLSGTAFESLLPEIAPLNRDRVRIVIGQVLFGTIGAMLALVVAGPIIDAFGFPVMAGLAAVVAMASRYIGLAGVWRHVRRDVEPAARLKVFSAVRSTFRNDQFLYFLPTFILFNLGITLMTAGLPFFAKEVILADGPITVSLFGFSPGLEEGAVTSIMAGVAILVVLLTLPAVYWLALRRGKAWVYSASMLIGAVYIPALFFMGFVPGLPKLLQAVLFIAPVGLAMTGVFVFPNAIMADVIDYDALRTGMRREALYYSTQNLVEKTVVALHAAILAGLLTLGGTAGDTIGIQLVGPVAGLSILLGYLVFRGYRLPDTVTAETTASLAAGGPRLSLPFRPRRGRAGPH